MGVIKLNEQCQPHCIPPPNYKEVISYCIVLLIMISSLVSHYCILCQNIMNSSTFELYIDKSRWVQYRTKSLEHKGLWFFIKANKWKNLLEMVAKAIGVSIGLCKPLARSSIANMSVTKWQRECTEKFCGSNEALLCRGKTCKAQQKDRRFCPRGRSIYSLAITMEQSGLIIN